MTKGKNRRLSLDSGFPYGLLVPFLVVVHFDFLHLNYHIKCKCFHTYIFVNVHVGILACLFFFPCWLSILFLAWLLE